MVDVRVQAILNVQVFVVPTGFFFFGLDGSAGYEYVQQGSLPVMSKFVVLCRSWGILCKLQNSSILVRLWQLFSIVMKVTVLLQLIVQDAVVVSIGFDFA